MKPTITAAFVLIAIPAFAAAPPRLVVDRDRAYAEPERNMRTLDVYSHRPVDGKNRPIVVWIHGGGWQAGDKTEVDVKPRAFVGKGCVFISVNYPLLPAVTIKQMAADVAKSIRWACDHAEAYGGDRTSVFVMGHSAGAQLAALVCTDDRYLKAEGLSLKIIKGCVPVDGDTYDVVARIATGTRHALKFGSVESQVELSAVTHVAPNKGIPPFLILHIPNTPPESGTTAQAQILAKALERASVSTRVFQGDGKNHSTLDSDLGRPGDKPTEVLFEFMDRCMTSSRHGATSSRE